MKLWLDNVYFLLISNDLKEFQISIIFEIDDLYAKLILKLFKATTFVQRTPKIKGKNTTKIQKKKYVHIYNTT